MKPRCLDANVLLVWLVGKCDPSKLGTAKGVKEYSRSHFDLIDRFVDNAPKLVTTPNVLTEVSNLIGEGSKVIVKDANTVFAEFVAKVDEIYYPSKEVLQESSFSKLGLSDCVLLACIRDHDADLLTTDHDLFGVAKGQDLRAYNIWHGYTPY